ncbi:FMN-dependent NADH-azoreductase [Hyella patelloides LEGE 07179]|uniref:FMN dependent NADH:quinone oxidoreductase n=1 Tax=Hyella patelloides LEGE 07179 TaxID=945734 RepID=A0A563W001_9CYAN|nr:NAD(P)H-dependent oxidoreductase [Hyella patelloides]VEP16843.1 FMN-dependent NADH-azoreductase [Hyella patelloides LEGE 07179]
MTQLLHIDSSPRGDRSHSRRLTKEFIETWQQNHPQDTVIYRDIGHYAPPHVDETWIASAFTPLEQQTDEMLKTLSTSNELVHEFLAADIYVIGVPMYNFSIPSGFKAYIDQIVRINKTFLFEPEDREATYKPLVMGKKMFIIAVRGDSGYAPGGHNEKLNHQDNYLRTVFGFIGIIDITVVHVENDEFGGQLLADSIATARNQIARLTQV